MESSQLQETLFQIQQGNDVERERLINHYRPYIVNVVGNICKRYITWSDDEASVGLIAFNRALETFEQDKGRSFLNYVYLLVKRDLIDYFRKESRQHELVTYSISEGNEQGNDQTEVRASLELHQQSNHSSDLVEEILELNTKLNTFNISFEELEKHSPKHVDTRMKINEMASEFLNYPKAVDELLGKKMFPMSTFTKLTGYRPKTIERHRKYLITIIMIKLHPEWVHLSTFVQGGHGSVKK